MARKRFSFPQLAFFSGADRWLVILPLTLSLFGLLLIFDASAVAALHDFNDKFHFFRQQSIWLILGIFLFFLCSQLNYRFWKKIALPFFLVNLFFLVLVLIPGLGKQIYGGRRWLQFGFFGFQPAELTKLSLTFYLATLFEKKRDFLPFLVVTGVLLLLLLLEPDFGTAVIISATAFAIYFLAGAPWGQIILVGLLAAVGAPLLILFSPYRRQRLLTFFNSSFDVQGASYHLRQILIALGSGGIWGRGLGQSRQKFLFLPEVTTDSIFAVIAEELGFFGATILILALFFLVYRIFRLAILSKDPFGKMLVAGIGFFLGLQIIINLGAMVALFPLTGIPLPFISYGGSSLLVLLAGMGIVYNVSKNKY